MQEFGRAAFCYVCSALNDQVIGHPELAALGFDGSRHSIVSADIRELPVFGEFPDDDLFPFDANPDDGDLGGAIRIDGHKVGKMAGIDHSFGRVWNVHCDSHFLFLEVVWSFGVEGF